MRSITRAAIAAAFLSLLVPQAAFGMAKPHVAPHPDTAPIDSLAATAKSSVSGALLPVGSASLISGGNAGTNSISFTSLTDGDIVVVTDPNYFTGHAGLFDHSHYSGILSYAMLSANVDPYNGVQYEKCAKYRLNDRAYALRVPQEYGHRIAVRDWASGSSASRTRSWRPRPIFRLSTARSWSGPRTGTSRESTLTLMAASGSGPSIWSTADTPHSSGTGADTAAGGR